MGELLQPTHMLLLFALLAIGLFIWAVQRISRAIEGSNDRRDDRNLRKHG